MSNIIGFLENAGRDAAMRYAAREQLLQMMKREQIASERAVLSELLGARETMYCGTNVPGEKAPGKKTPAKTPAKKKPGKKGPTKKK